MFHLFRSMKRLVSFANKGEEPEDFIQHYLMELNHIIVELETGMTKLLADQKRIVKQIDMAKEKLDKRNSQAFDALSAGKDEFAQRVLEDKILIQRELHHLEELYERTTFQLNDLRQKLKTMKAEYQELKLKMDSFQAKSNQAKYYDKNRKSHSQLGYDDTFYPVSKITDDMQIEAAEELQKMKNILKNKQ